MNQKPLFALKPGLKLILASASPRRKEFLDSWGLPYDILPPKLIEPEPDEQETPTDYTLRLAKAKAQAAMDQLDLGLKSKSLIISADTVVTLKGQILGKPCDAKEALEMLKLLAGHKHLVTSSVYLLFPPTFKDPYFSFSESSTVYFHSFTSEILASYVQTGEPLDKAGAYAIQGRGAFLIEKIEGSWATVVGLPICRLVQELLLRGFLVAKEPLL
ncbi:MAG: septum formation protein Maf [Desulfovibrionaceae bacterium]|nr:septum formation protein Maf [Desulfovibrionaceae bacterium]